MRLVPANTSSFLARAVDDARRFAGERERVLPLDALRAAAPRAPRSGCRSSARTS
jgi:hypothetical protein